MNQQYKELFQMVARNGALTAEQTLAALKTESGHDKEIETTLFMRDQYSKLEDKISSNEELDFSDYIHLYTASVLSRNILQKNINTWTAIVAEYDDNLIPKLKEVANEANEEKRNTLVDEFFN